MHLLFLNNVHHLLQLVEYLAFLLIVLAFDLLILVLLFHCFEFLYNNLLQILFYAIKQLVLLFLFDHLIMLDLLLLLNMHLNKLDLHYIAQVYHGQYEVYNNIHLQILMKLICLNFYILHYFLQVILSDSNGYQFLALCQILYVVQHKLRIQL